MLTVDSIMTRRVVSATPDLSLDGARALMHEHGVRHLPVIERGRVVGILSERDLMERAGRLRRAKRTRDGEVVPQVRDSMSVSVETVMPDESVSRAGRRMLDRRISCLPVVQDGRTVGILTELDLMRLYERVCRFSGHAAALDPPVGTRASRKPVVIAPDTTAVEAFELSRAKGVRHLLVVHDGWLVGVISDRDLLPMVARAEDELREVRSLMTRDFAGVVPEARMSAVAKCMLDNGFHSLPVLVDGSLHGMVTSADVLAALCAIPEGLLEEAWSGEAAP